MAAWHAVADLVGLMTWLCIWNCGDSALNSSARSIEIASHVAGGNYRLAAAFDFRRQIAFVKFIGAHAEYDRIDVH